MPADPILGPLLLQLLFIVFCSFINSAESAIISLDDKKLNQWSSNGDTKAKSIIILTDTANNFLNLTRFLRNIILILSGIFFAKDIAPSMCLLFTGDTAINATCIILVLLAALLQCMIFLTFAYNIAKRIGAGHAKSIAYMSINIINFLYLLFKPFTFIVEITSSAIAKLFNIPIISNKVTEEEIRLMMDVNSEKGTIHSDEYTMIENIFGFSDTSAEDIMVHRTDVQALSINETPENIIKAIYNSGLSRFPIYDEDIDDIVGILSTKRFLLNLQSENPKPLRQILYKAYLVPETVQADVLFRGMQKNNTHMAVVVDEYGGMSGLVTMEDLLEEIVGNIYDETDPHVELEIVKLDENKWRCVGTIELETLNKTLDISLPLDEDYDTLSGMIFNCFNVIPEDGSQPEVEVNNLHIRVLEIKDHRVVKAVISKMLVRNDDDELREDLMKNDKHK